MPKSKKRGRSVGSRNGEGCLVKIGKYYYGVIMVDGKKYQQSLHVTDMKTAKESLRKWVADKLSKKVTVKPTQLKVDEVWQRVEYILPTIEHKSNGTLKSWRTAVNKFTTYCDERGISNLYDVDEMLVRGFYGSLSGKVKSSSLKIYNSKLHLIWNLLIKDKSNPFNEIKTENLSPEMPTYMYDKLTDAEIHDLMTAAYETDIYIENQNQEYFTLFLIARYTGLRLKDCIHLKYTDIKFERNIITLTPFKTMKHGNTVTIPMVKPLSEHLKKMESSEFDKMLYNSTHGIKNPDDPYSLANKDKPHYVIPSLARKYDESESNVYKTICKIFRKAGINTTKVYQRDGKWYKKSFYSFRVSMASALGNSGCPLSVAISIMGHSEEMFQHYFRLDEEAAKEYMQKAFE